jgi:hypothetical protein
MQVEEPLLVSRSDTALPWHEAVALVHAVAEAVSDGRLGSVPDLSDLTVTADGTVGARRGGARDSAEPAETARELRRLLAQLLNPGAPAELRDLASQHRERADGTPAEFAHALAFFQRPRRDDGLQVLAARLRRSQEQSALESELHRLTQKARTEEHKPKEPSDCTPSDGEPGSRQSHIRLAALVAIGALAVVTLLALFARQPSPGLLRSTGGASGALLATLRGIAHSALGGSRREPRTADVPKKEKAPSAREHPGARRRAPETSSEPALSRQANGRAPVEIVRATEPEFVDVLVSRGPEERLSPISSRIYDRRNIDVIPAALLRPRPPNLTPTTVPAGQIGRLEVVVAEDGHVEQVRLLSTTINRRYYDSMILAAVKAWLFRPASRGGQPVRYRLEIPLT